MIHSICDFYIICLILTWHLISIYHIFKLIVYGQIGQEMEGVANHVVQGLKTIKEQGEFSLKMVVNLVLDLGPKQNTAIPKIVHVTVTLTIGVLVVSKLHKLPILISSA